MKNGWIIRLRDNCKTVDTNEWMRLSSQDKSGDNPGIRQISGLAKDINYMTTLDLNILTIRL